MELVLKVAKLENEKFLHITNTDQTQANDSDTCNSKAFDIMLEPGC